MLTPAHRRHVRYAPPHRTRSEPCAPLPARATCRALQLAELHRKYRIMEGDRRQYSEESQNVIRRQRAAIDKLKSDNMALKQEIEVVTRADYVPPAHVQDKITRLQDEADSYSRKIGLEHRRVEELEKTISVLTTKAMEQRKRMGGVNSARESSVQVDKQVKTLENRLEKALVKFNEALAHNKSLRANIDNLRRERVVFDQIYKKLERELHDRNAEMANVIEVSNIAYEARDQAQNEIAALKAQADKEQAAFELEWRELGSILEHDRKVAEDKRKADINGKLSMAEERGLRKKIVKGEWGLIKNKAGHHLVAEKASTYEEAFKRIHEATGITDIDDLVNSFIQAEDDNFTLFNYVAELNQEMEKLEEEVQDLRGELEKCRGQGATGETQRKKLLQDLEARLQVTQGKAETYGQKHAHAKRTLNGLKQGIMSIFSKIGCSAAEMREALGDTGITEDTMTTYLGVIEQRANEILMRYAAVQRAATSADGANIGASPGRTDGASTYRGSSRGGEGSSRPGSSRPGSSRPPTTGTQGAGPRASATGSLVIDLPSTKEECNSEESSEEELDDRPLTRDELQERTMRNLSKTGGRARKPSRRKA